MTTQTPGIYGDSAHRDSTRAHDSDEIDLRRYLLILLRWWREILLITFLAGVIAALGIWFLNSRQAPVYSASADIVILRLSSVIELDDRVSTSIGTPQAEGLGWQTSLLQLIDNVDIINAVISELGDELPQHYRSVGALVSVVEGSIPTSVNDLLVSNIIRITAKTDDPELSAKIADSWARHLVDHINDLYGTVPESMVANVTAERDRAFSAYQEAEKELENFIRTNQLDALSRQMNEKAGLRGEIMINYSRMLSSVVSSGYSAQLSLYNTLVNAPIAHAASLIGTQSAGNAQSLANLYSLRTSAMSQLNQARNMERTLTEGGEAAAKSNVTALRLLKLTTFSSFLGTVNVPLLGETDEIAMTLEEQLTDVAALITVLEEYVSQLEEDITQLAEAPMIGADITSINGVATGLDSNAFVAETGMYTNATSAYAHLLTPSGVVDPTAVEGSGLGSNVHEDLLLQLEEEIRTMQGQIAMEQATLRQLTHERDLAWNTYGAVGNKLQELTLLRSSANSEVRLGNPAMVPVSAQAPISPVLPSVALAVVGFVAAVILALLIESFGGSPFFARRSTSALS